MLVVMWAIVLIIPMAFTALVLLGLVWSPMATLVCAKLGQPGSKRAYAAQGFRYSASLFLPWCYLVSKMLGRPIPETAVKAVYGALFTAWLLFLVVMKVVIGLFSIVAVALGGESGPDVLVALSSVVVLVLASFDYGTWRRSLRKLREHHESPKHAGQGIARPYLKPFWLVGAWTVAHGLPLVVFFAAGLLLEI